MGPVVVPTTADEVVQLKRAFPGTVVGILCDDVAAVSAPAPHQTASSTTLRCHAHARNPLCVHNAEDCMRILACVVLIGKIKAFCTPPKCTQRSSPPLLPPPSASLLFLLHPVDPSSLPPFPRACNHTANAATRPTSTVAAAAAASDPAHVIISAFSKQPAEGCQRHRRRGGWECKWQQRR